MFFNKFRCADVCVIFIILNFINNTTSVRINKEKETAFLRSYLEQKATLRDDEIINRRLLPKHGGKEQVLEWEESGYFEGDLILSSQQREVLVGQMVNSSARNGLLDAAKLWPNGVIYYRIMVNDFSLPQIRLIKWALREIMRKSCVKFKRHRKSIQDVVLIQGSRKGCCSHVGYQGDEQLINLDASSPPGSGCFRRGTILHEILHALGFFHMQSTYDRDLFVKINWNNISDGGQHNFVKYDNSSVTNYGVTYDYDSVLHYSERAFSKNNEITIVPIQEGVKIGQRIRLSKKDILKLNKMYCNVE